MESIVEGLDDRDMEQVSGLEKLGLSRKEAILIVYLSKVKEATSKEIETATFLRQPEVSMGMRTLRVNGWINEREVSVEGKGRPYKIYSLKTLLLEIIRHYEELKLNESARSKEAIRKLRELRSEKNGRE